MTELERDLLLVAREIGPDVVESFISMVRSAVGGASKKDIELQALKTATLAAYRASYRNLNA